MDTKSPDSNKTFIRCAIFFVSSFIRSSFLVSPRHLSRSTFAFTLAAINDRESLYTVAVKRLKTLPAI
jgi:hypothetical protein